MGYFNRILVANRGEIARRIIRTCKSLGIETVAVYSDADKEAPFVSEADQSVPIGPAQAKQSYLDIEKIIQAAKDTASDAIHPAYGFLAENALFAKRCKQENIRFIGPEPEMITMMGDKIQARKKMETAGVPIVPGYNGKLESIEQALSVAESLGYPLMLKASAGGGGIGMELVKNEDELKRSYASTMKKANSFFGDGSLFLEKWIENPRHIEVQIVCDHHGNGIHLFERECSIQRRNQKILEESPSPFLDEKLRSKLCETALKGAKNINYTNIGTMEFIFDGDQNYYFLEMNTRLQVEHPVTEEITGVDLVALQIKIAANGVLSLRQEDVAIKGHAIENRLYAEDPKTFFPSPGTLKTLQLPDEGVRLDFGLEEGNQVTPFYDPMIGKIITYGENRDSAIRQMEKVLEKIKVEGIKTNLPLLQEILRSEAFTTGNYTTKFVENHFHLQKA